MRSRSVARKLYSMVRYRDAGTRLDQEGLLDSEGSRLAEKLDFEKLQAVDVIDSLDKKIVRWEKTHNRITRFAVLSAILLLMSLLGVKFQISLIGIKLEQIENIKELIVVFYIVIFAGVTSDKIQIAELKSLKKHVYIRKYGMDMYIAMHKTFPYSFASPDPTRLFAHPQYMPIGFAKLVTWIPQALMAFVGVMGIIAFLWGHYTILISIWQFPNIEVFWARTIVILAGAYVVLSPISWVAREKFPLSYVDREQMEAVTLYDEQTGKFTADVANLALELIRKKERTTLRLKGFLMTLFVVGVFFVTLRYGPAIQEVSILVSKSIFG
ncbi:MAG: hypothetical protein GQ535_14740 [Rhodobacteraceae bacterium]|nr:hypothetical protein [Paracoccaceae bacterium]